MTYSGMILSNKEKNRKLCNIKNGRHTHVEDMSCALRAARWVGGMLPQENFNFQPGFPDF